MSMILEYISHVQEMCKLRRFRYLGSIVLCILITQKVWGIGHQHKTLRRVVTAVALVANHVASQESSTLCACKVLKMHESKEHKTLKVSMFF